MVTGKQRKLLFYYNQQLDLSNNITEMNNQHVYHITQAQKLTRDTMAKKFYSDAER